MADIEEILEEFEGEDTIEKFEEMMHQVSKWVIDEREGSNLDEMIMDFGDDGGLFFFHTQNPKELDSQTTDLVRAFMQTTQPVHLTRDIVEDNYQEFTKANVRNELETQFNEFLGISFSDMIVSNFEENLDFDTGDRKPGEKTQPSDQTTL
jgi:chlorite dismutase